MCVENHYMYVQPYREWKEIMKSIKIILFILIFWCCCPSSDKSVLCGPDQMDSMVIQGI